MKHFKEYFLEALSAENIKKLEEYITDENVDDVIKMYIRHSNKSSIEGKEYSAILVSTSDTTNCSFVS